jgi:hypothetical protein
MWAPELPHPNTNTNMYASLQTDSSFSSIDSEEIFKRMLIVAHPLSLPSLT